MDDATRTVIDYFEQLNQIPRCSKQEHKISEWLRQWAVNRGLTVVSDSAGNLVVRVPASQGFEDAPGIILQGHMDMVCEKRADSDHDFAKDPICMEQEGPWLHAKETTLGADNGIAIAMALALVDNPVVVHPPLELYFTVDEETGLTGVRGMDPTLLSGRILVNLDSEDEGVFVVGCAGGRNTVIQRSIARVPTDPGHALMAFSAFGMKGGHSGVDIAKHRANANKVMARLLRAGLTVAPLRFVKLEGGTGRNVIPRAAKALVACPTDSVDAVRSAIESLGEVIKQEHHAADPDLTIQVDHRGAPVSDIQSVSPTDSALIVDLLMALPSGPLEMIADNPLLVQTSVNLSLVKLDDEGVSITSNQRSSAPSRLDAVCLAVESVGRLAGATAGTSTGYPSWPVNWESALLSRCKTIYQHLFDVDPTVQVMHAGLECGVIGDRCAGMDMISLGPTIENPHSPSERLYLPSVGKVWRLMVALLASYGPER